MIEYIKYLREVSRKYGFTRTLMYIQTGRAFTYREFKERYVWISAAKVAKNLPWSNERLQKARKIIEASQKISNITQQQ